MAYHFTTYNYPHNVNHHQEIHYSFNEEFDSTWNFIYFGYSLAQKKAYAFVRFGRTGRVATLSWNDMNHFRPDRLLFLVGRCGGVNQLTGAYSSIKFNYEKGAFINDDNILLNSYIGDQKKPVFKIPN